VAFLGHYNCSVVIIILTQNMIHKVCILITPNYVANRATSPFLPPVSIMF
jgi:hypothetical protein